MGSSHSKSSRGRSSVSVKPILKKLHSSSHSYTYSSHSEKNSLDLDRGWEEQPSFPGYTSVTTSHSYPDNQQYTFSSTGTSASAAGAAVGADLDSFSSDLNKLGGLSLSSTSSTVPTTTTATSSGFTITPTLSSTTSAVTTVATLSSHGRSISNNSVATSGSAGRNGSFVHPFQQTPRTSTPPLLPYATARASLDNCYISGSSSNLREYSSTTITETDDAEDNDIEVSTFGCPSRASTLPQISSNSTASLQKQQHHHRQSSLPNSSSSTSSSPEVTTATSHPLRVATAARSASAAVVTSAVSASAPRFSSQPRSSVDGHLTSSSLLASTVTESSPLSSPSTTPMACSPQMPSSTSTSATSPLSFRHSLDMNNFRIRSRSDVDTQTRQEQVRRARKKFEEKERAKQEKYSREQSRKKERQGIKEAQRQERISFQKPNISDMVNVRTSSSTFDSAGHRPAYSRKSTGASRYNDGAVITNEKPDYEIGGYDDAFPGQDPTADDVHFEPNRRTKRRNRNGSPWTAFVLWFRTRLLKLGRR